MKAIKFFAAMFAAAVMFTACEDKPVPPVIPGGDSAEKPNVEAGEGKVVVVINTVDSAFVCDNGVIYLTGSFNGWSTDLEQVVKFEKIEGFDNWYKAEYTPDADPSQCKAAHATADGKFSYDYEWTSDIEVLDGDALAADNGFGNINNLEVTGTGVVYVKVTKWAKDPCAVDTEEKNPAGEATFTLTANNLPEGYEIGIVGVLEAAEWDIANPVVMTKSGDVYTAKANVKAACEYKYFVRKEGAEWSWDFGEDGGNRKMPIDLKAVDTVDAWKLPAE